MGYFKNKLIEQQIEVGDRHPMTYMATKKYYAGSTAIWVMGFLTGLMIGVVI